MPQFKHSKIVFVVGGPGSGKGTQCARIVEKYNFCHLSTGDLLRNEVNTGSKRGAEINRIMQAGGLVPMEIVLSLLKEAITLHIGAKGYLIDGYPRELEQGTRFEKEIVTPKAVIYFDVPDSVMAERLQERGKTSGRVDDNAESIKKRIKTFHEHSDAIIQHYKKLGVLRTIDARGSVEAVFQEVVKVMNTI